MHALARFKLFFLVVGLFVTSMWSGAIFVSGDPFNFYGSTDSTKQEFQFTKTTLPLPAVQNLDGLSNGLRSFVGVGDFNNDGFEDFLTIYNVGFRQTWLFLIENVKGKYFRVANETSGLNPFSSNPNLVSAVFADFDNDGWDDLFLAHSGEDHLVLKNDHGKFRLWQRISNVEDTVVPALFDFNNDGFLDLYIPNRISIDVISDFRRLGFWIGRYGAIKNNSGGPDQILLNQGGRSFVNATKSLGLVESRYAWAVGIDDFNQDGFPDIFVANDFGQDEFFLNENGRKVKDATAAMFGELRSRASMSAEVADVNGDGLPDIFVSNRNHPLMRHGFNSLWVNGGGATPKFTDQAKDLRLEGCGWSWGSKFVDFDMDGNLDLAIVNGLFGNQDSYFWYYFGFYPAIPSELLAYDKFRISATPTAALAPNQNGCIFLRKDDYFVNIAASVGFIDKQAKRGLAVVDVNNDGLQDLLVSHVGSPPTIFNLELKKNFDWIGLQLEGTKSNRDAIGAKVSLIQGASKRVQSIYPTNGFQSQSTKRVVFALPDSRSPYQIQIDWPSGTKQKLSSVKMNAYTKVREP